MARSLTRERPTVLGFVRGTSPPTATGARLSDTGQPRIHGARPTRSGTARPAGPGRDQILVIRRVPMARDILAGRPAMVRSGKPGRTRRGSPTTGVAGHRDLAARAISPRNPSVKAALVVLRAGGHRRCLPRCLLLRQLRPTQVPPSACRRLVALRHRTARRRWAVPPPRPVLRQLAMPQSRAVRRLRIVHRRRPATGLRAACHRQARRVPRSRRLPPMRDTNRRRTTTTLRPFP